MSCEHGTVRWNLAFLSTEIVCYSVGLAFLDPNAVAPLMLKRLGATGLAIGVFAAIRYILFSAFQVFTAHALHGKPRQKPWLNIVSTCTRLPLIVLPWFLWHAADSAAARSRALTAVFLLLALWTLGDGLGYVAWMEIVARAFPERTRGRFFAATQLACGVAGILAAGIVVRGILNSPRLPYPHNYAALSFLSALIFAVSIVLLLSIREPPAPGDMGESLPPLKEFFRRLPGFVLADRTFGSLCIVQLLAGFGGAAAPFYVLYATSHFHLKDSWGGIYQTLQAVGVVAFMPLWGWLSEKYGSRISIRGVALACFLTPVMALFPGVLSPWLFGLTFLIMGGSLGWGLWITLNHYLLTHTSESERPIFVALMSVLFLPSALYPITGGLLVRHDRLIQLGHLPALFLLTALVTALGLFMAARLPVPGKE